MGLRAQDVYAILSSKIRNSPTGTGGTPNYNHLPHKPKINAVELAGEQTLGDLGIQPSGDYLTAEDLSDNFVEF